MQNFSCSKCGSINVYIDDRGNQKALMCKDCGSWLKWVGKKEIPLVVQYIREHIQEDDKKVHVVGEDKTNYTLHVMFIGGVSENMINLTKEKVDDFMSWWDSESYSKYEIKIDDCFDTVRSFRKESILYVDVCKC